MAGKGRKPQRPKVAVPPAVIEQHLEEQLAFLRKSARDFDHGDRTEFRRLAATLRVLIHHNPPNSISLLEQVGLAGEPFIASGAPLDPANMLPETPLIMFRMGPASVSVVPLCEISDIGQLRPMTQADWWNEAIIKDQYDTRLTRKQLVLAVANQAGGMHVDPELDEEYHKLAHEHSTGWTTGMSSAPLEDVEKATVRQIAWEVIESVGRSLEKRAGNRLCDCGSGRKHRYCCGKARGTNHP